MTKLDILYNYIKELGRPFRVHIFHECLYGELKLYRLPSNGNEVFALHYTKRNEEPCIYVLAVNGKTMLDVTDVQRNGFELTAFKVHHFQVEGVEKEFWIPEAIYLTCGNDIDELRKRFEDANEENHDYHKIYVGKNEDDFYVGAKVRRLY